jgi:hypothetical protein
MGLAQASEMPGEAGMDLILAGFGIGYACAEEQAE